MPQLPSGRHVALDPEPLSQLREQAARGNLVHQLMAIKTAEDVFGHIGIHYFRPKTGAGRAQEFDKGSATVPESLEPYPSGFNLVSIQDELAHWPAEDRNAFLLFLREPRTQSYLERLLNNVRQAQKLLLDHPTTLPGLVATWWALDVHPLQEEGNAFSFEATHNGKTVPTKQ